MARALLSIPNTMRLLLVDDSGLARAAAARALSVLEVHVVSLGSAEEAAHIDPTTLTGAILDLEIGEASGVDLALALRARNERLSIAFLTAGASHTELARARAIGPVFDKTAGTEGVVSWAKDVVVRSPLGP